MNVPSWINPVYFINPHPEGKHDLRFLERPLSFSPSHNLLLHSMVTFSECKMTGASLTLACLLQLFFLSSFLIFYPILPPHALLPPFLSAYFVNCCCNAEVQSSVTCLSTQINMNLGEFALLQCKQIGEGPFISSDSGQLWGSEAANFCVLDLGGGM